MLRDWLRRFAAAARGAIGAVIRAWTEAEIDSSEFGRLGTDLLGGFTTALGDRIAAAPRSCPSRTSPHSPSWPWSSAATTTP